MALVCSSCGKENRDNARFCRGCARPLDEPGASPDVEAARRERVDRARRRAQRRKAAAAAHPQAARRPWVAVLIVAALLLVAGGWWATRHRPAAPTPATARPALGGGLVEGVLPASAVAAPVPATTAPAAEPEGAAAAAAVERLRESVEQLAQEDRAKAAAQARLRQQVALERQRADEARRRAEAAAHAAPAATVPAAPALASPPAPGPAVAAAAPATPTAPAPPPVVTSVDQVCAGAGNVFARDFCRIRECDKPANVRDPICVRFRQMNEERRRAAELR